MSICVSADVPRIFQLLTVPEYLEAWMWFPAVEADARLNASRSEHEYRLDCYSSGRLRASISGAYRVCRHRKLLFTWNNSGLSSRASIVDIRLRGNFGSSILELRHAGLASAAEYFWQMAMWRASFEQLVRLTTNSRLLPEWA